MFDVWFEGESVEPVVMQQLETKLQEAFNLPASQAAVLGNGKSHRIKRGCTADKAQKLSDQFASWAQKCVSRRLNTPSDPAHPVRSHHLTQFHRPAHLHSQQPVSLSLPNPGT